ncbi:MAG TPA: AIR synthase family protein [Candidatus Pullilachnospira intestinigallinarum]|nr:AIR synthase family protein [Candidatus Pullilachnospira intestinigallinarum]
MKIGKLPEPVLIRSVLKQVKHRREEVLVGPSVGQDCAALQVGPEEVLVMSTDPITGTVKDMGSHCIHITANDLAASGAEPLGVMLTVMLPDSMEEPQLRRLMQDAEKTCEELNIEILGGHTEITNVVRQPLVSVTGVGKILRSQLSTLRQIKPGQDVVVTKWIGLEATAILAKEREEELTARFPAGLVDVAKSFDRYLSVVKDARIAVSCGVTAMHDITEGGVFGALWEMAGGAGVGLEVDMKKIPIRQETVEICEYFGLNPYQIMSSGSMMIVTDQGHELVRRLENEGIHGTVIGRTTDGNDRILRNGEDVRYLDKPQPDELYKVLG